ncbi:unnamed protein product, partial [Heterosigma akashiwo]
DLTANSPGCLAIPDDDYVKKYQQNPELWPVEFFLVAFRRTKNKQSHKTETQLLVRNSSNGTSKWGLGTGAPATRWMLSSVERPPFGYEWSRRTKRLSDPMPATENSRIIFEAANFPEYASDGQTSWTYTKIDVVGDAFNQDSGLSDPELEDYAKQILGNIRAELSKKISDGDNLNCWESSRLSIVKNVAESDGCVAALQGTLRMSGLFASRADGSPSSRYISLKDGAPDPDELVQSMRIFTMFPQMPNPLPLPSASPEELQKELASRQSRLTESGKDPHKDKYGRRFTHISTSNVSNTIHGVYLTLDATGLTELDEVPAFDMFGTKRIKREWKSLEDLKVLDLDGESISTEDPKPTFISGYIARQLVREHIIKVDSLAG